MALISSTGHDEEVLKDPSDSLAREKEMRATPTKVLPVCTEYFGSYNVTSIGNWSKKLKIFFF